MSTLHPDVEITSDNSLKKNQRLFCSILKQRLMLTSLIRWLGNTLYKLPAESGPFTYFTIIDLALIDSWIFFRDICKSGVSRRKFAQVVVEEGATSEDDNGKNAVAQRNPLETNEPSEKKRKTSATSECRNRTMDSRNICWSTVCGECSTKICPNCVD